MSTITLKKIYEDIRLMKKDIERIKTLVEEDYFELADDVKKEIEGAKKTPRSKFIKHEEVSRRFS